jgi:predicted RNase H-like HicB family nuclease
MTPASVDPGKRRYTAVVAPGEEQYVVEVPALPGCFTQGKTFGEAVDRVREAIRVHIAGRRRMESPCRRKRSIQLLCWLRCRYVRPKRNEMQRQQCLR